MAIYVKMSLINIFSPSSGFQSHHDLNKHVYFTRIALQTQQLMTSQIRSDIEYSTQTCNIFVLISYSKLKKKYNLTDDFSIRFDDDSC